MCFAGAWRDIFLIRDGYLMSAVVACFLGALVFNLILGQFHLGFEGQPISHNNHLWNFLSMALVGLAATLLGGCPLRQLVLASQGDGSAFAAVWGMFAGAAVAHNFRLAASPKGVPVGGQVAVAAGLAVCLLVGWVAREK